MCRTDYLLRVGAGSLKSRQHKFLVRRRCGGGRSSAPTSNDHAYLKRVDTTHVPAVAAVLNATPRAFYECRRDNTRATSTWTASLPATTAPRR